MALQMGEWPGAEGLPLMLDESDARARIGSSCGRSSPRPATRTGPSGDQRWILNVDRYRHSRSLGRLDRPNAFGDAQICLRCGLCDGADLKPNLVQSEEVAQSRPAATGEIQRARICAWETSLKPQPGPDRSASRRFQLIVEPVLVGIAAKSELVREFWGEHGKAGGLHTGKCDPQMISRNEEEVRCVEPSHRVRPSPGPTRVRYSLNLGGLVENTFRPTQYRRDSACYLAVRQSSCARTHGPRMPAGVT